MAHTYIVTGIQHTGDTATILGTVDNIPVSITCNWSAIQQQPNVASFEAFITPIMLAAAFPPQPITFIGFNGTWSS